MRRDFDDDYKLGVLLEWDVTDRHKRKDILTRESIKHSHIESWRRQLEHKETKTRQKNSEEDLDKIISDIDFYLKMQERFLNIAKIMLEGIRRQR